MIIKKPGKDLVWFYEALDYEKSITFLLMLPQSFILKSKL